MKKLQKTMTTTILSAVVLAVVAGTVQFNYSQPDGQMTAGGAAWA